MCSFGCHIDENDSNNIKVICKGCGKILMTTKEYLRDDFFNSGWVLNQPGSVPLMFSPRSFTYCKECFEKKMNK